MPPYRKHTILDNSSLVDVEQLEYDCGGWEYELTERMAAFSIRWLGLNYPELEFSVVKGKVEARKFAYRRYVSGKYVVADWRKV